MKGGTTLIVSTGDLFGDDPDHLQGGGRSPGHRLLAKRKIEDLWQGSYIHQTLSGTWDWR